MGYNAASPGWTLGKSRKKNYYAYAMDGDRGIVASWPECEARVRGHRARYRGFATRGEAQAWLDAGASYEDKRIGRRAESEALPEDAVFFDAGTGRGLGTEVNVTDREGVPILFLGVEARHLTPWGTLLLDDRTNNYGELLGCRHALAIALSQDRRAVYGDSALVLDYWSKGHVTAKKRARDPDLYRLAVETAVLRSEFEKAGGRLLKVSGGVNPADLGFHRD